MADDETLMESFWQVARQVRQMSMQALAPWDITPSHARAMGVLTRHGVIRLSELSDHLRIAARTATEVVDALEERGFVQRQGDPEDRRATLVSLTDEGRRVSDAIRATRAAEAERFFGTLSAADQAHLSRILRKFTR
ncbi:MAG: MarR family transcriptional regulator [Pseudonocardiales bacterium]|nr:MAG: MarR family transcriptional regulator [Pseudonocardiales bacterium]